MITGACTSSTTCTSTRLPVPKINPVERKGIVHVVINVKMRNGTEMLLEFGLVFSS